MNKNSLSEKLANTISEKVEKKWKSINQTLSD